MTLLAQPRTRPHRSRRERLKEIGLALGPYARPHRRQLVNALMASCLVTLAQLALPLPMKGIVELSLADGRRNASVSGLLTAQGSPVMWLAGVFVVLGFAFGLAEHWQRLSVSRFVVATINDARVGILKGLIETPDAARRDAGDVVTRVVGDTARLRVGMRGVLVHLLQHGLFFVGVSAVLTAVDVRLGLGYLLGLILALSVAVVGTAATERLARRSRGRESRHAEAALRAATDTGTELEVKDPERERSIALITQVKGRTAWVVQGILAVTACLVLLLAVRLADSGQVTSGDVALVGSYLLMLHYPMMRLGRQLTRLGPQMTSAERLAGLAEPDGRGR
jgi:ABC-type multidrug transport system fused ATPase/permease subunit